MAETMRAARLHEFGEPLRVDEVPIPSVGPDDALIEVLQSGFNGGDVHMRRGDHRAIHPTLPVTIGHDGAGEVVEVGENVDRLAPGDRVLVNAAVTCGSCEFCRDGLEQLCDSTRVMGYTTYLGERGSPDQHGWERYRDGFTAEYCRIPAGNAVKLAPEDDIDQVMLAKRMGVGYHALEMARLDAGETVVVNGGTGPTGVGAVLAALASGAARIAVVARDRRRLESVGSIDPDRIVTISTRQGPVRERIEDLTGGEGPDVMLDLTPGGVESTIECIQGLRRGGRVVLLGGSHEDLRLDYHHLYRNHPTIMFSRGVHVKDFRRLLEIYRHGVVDVAAIEADYFDLDGADAALDLLESPGERPAIPMVVPG